MVSKTVLRVIGKIGSGSKKLQRVSPQDDARLTLSSRTDS
jgi:hypothetical protein